MATEINSIKLTFFRILDGTIKLEQIRKSTQYTEMIIPRLEALVLLFLSFISFSIYSVNRPLSLQFLPFCLPTTSYSHPASPQSAPRNIIYPYNLSLLSFSATIFCLIESPPDTTLSKYFASSSICISRDCAIWYSPSPILLK